MSMSGRVVGGDFLNATVTAAPFGSDLIVQVGFKRRKLNAEQVASWAEVVTSDSSTSTASVVGQAVAGAVLPRFISKSASAAVGATIDSKVKPPRTVRVEWADGKHSLMKLSDGLFTHLEMILRERRAEPETTAPAEVRPAAASATPAAPTVTEQAFSLVAGILKDRTATPSEPAASSATPDVTEQILKLASLRDAGVLTDEEFTAKKSELLSRM